MNWIVVLERFDGCGIKILNLIGCLLLLGFLMAFSKFSFFLFSHFWVFFLPLRLLKLERTNLILFPHCSFDLHCYLRCQGFGCDFYLRMNTNFFFLLGLGLFSYVLCLLVWLSGFSS